jgi:hypothetical protein
MHGYAVAGFIQQASGDALRVEEGPLYPALHRLVLRSDCHHFVDHGLITALQP